MGHAEPQVSALLQPYWMPFSANKEFKAEPRLFCVAAGHCRREIAEAVYQQLQTLDFTAPFLRAYPKAFELAQRDGRGGRQAGNLRRHHRRRPQDRRRVLPRLHLLGAPGLVRRGAGDDGSSATRS